jgi:formate dehydrogenase iron-sulfur subunit
MKGLLIDITKCIGCNACAEACREKNGLPEAKAANLGGERLSATRYTVVEQRGDHYVRRMCMHCNDPTCASVCPVGAFRKTKLGPVTYDAAKCIGCRYCMLACPFGVPRYEWDARWPKVSKCDLCADRLAAGQPTACAEACPTAATLFGDRDQLVEEARKRLAAAPGDYTDRIYGLQEVGGTAVLFLSPKPFAEMGMSTALQSDPLPLLTHRVLSKIPHLVSLGGVLLGGVWWITHRREEVAREEGGRS